MRISDWSSDVCTADLRLADPIAEHDREVLHRVVGVDERVAAGVQDEVEQGVARERGEHVVIEADPSGDLVLAGAVEVELDVDLRLAGLPVDPRGPAHRLISFMTSVSAFLKAVI